jgi:hypothetical protein
MRGVREFVQVVGVKNVMRKELAVEVYGLDELRQLDGPALIVANHASHLDTAVLVSTLPAKRRRRTAVGVASGYFFDSWVRTGASALVFNAFPIGAFSDWGSSDWGSSDRPGRRWIDSYAGQIAGEGLDCGHLP